MKNFKLTLLCLIIMFTLNICAQTKADSIAIKQVVKEFAEGFDSGNVNKVKKTIHPDFVKRGFIKSQNGKMAVSLMNAEQCLKMVEGMPKNNSPKDLHTQITITNIYNNIANVILKDDIFVEYYHIIKLDENWQIMNVLWTYNRHE